VCEILSAVVGAAQSLFYQILSAAGGIREAFDQARPLLRCPHLADWL